jgi:hypothetical protein
MGERADGCDIKTSALLLDEAFAPLSSMNIRFDNSYARLPERFFAKKKPACVPEPKLIRLNLGLAA